MKRICFFLFLLSIIAFSVTISSSQTPQAKPMNILVYPFDNMNDKKFSWIASGMTDTVIADLGTIQNINVFSEDDRRKAIKEIELSMTGLVKDELQLNVGKVMGANVIFTGSYTVLGERIRIIAKLINVETTKVEKSVKFDGNLNDLFQLQDKLIIGLLSEVKKIPIADLKAIDIQQEESKLSSKARPGNDAYMYYSKGLELHYTDQANALKFYDQAIGINPGYVEPYIKKITIYIETSSYDNALSAIETAKGIIKSRPNITFNQKGEPIVREYADLLYYNAFVLMEKGSFKESRRMANSSQKIYEKVFNTQYITFELMKILGWNDILRETRFTWKRSPDPISYNVIMLFFNSGAGYLVQFGLKNTEKYAMVNIDRAAIMNIFSDGRVFTLLNESEQILNNLKLTNSSTYVDLLNNYAIAHINKKEFPKAIEYLKKSVKLQKKNKTVNSLRYANTLEAYGLYYEKQGNYTRALKYYNDQLKQIEKLNLKNSFRYANAFDNLSYIYYKYYDDPCKQYEYLNESIEMRKRNNIYDKDYMMERDVEKLREKCEKNKWLTANCGRADNPVILIKDSRTENGVGEITKFTKYQSVKNINTRKAIAKKTAIIYAKINILSNYMRACRYKLRNGGIDWNAIYEGGGNIKVRKAIESIKGKITEEMYDDSQNCFLKFTNDANQKIVLPAKLKYENQ